MVACRERLHEAAEREGHGAPHHHGLASEAVRRDAAEQRRDQRADLEDRDHRADLRSARLVEVRAKVRVRQDAAHDALVVAEHEHAETREARHRQHEARAAEAEVPCQRVCGRSCIDDRARQAVARAQGRHRGGAAVRPRVQVGRQALRDRGLVLVERVDRLLHVVVRAHAGRDMPDAGSLVLRHGRRAAVRVVRCVGIARAEIVRDVRLGAAQLVGGADAPRATEDDVHFLERELPRVGEAAQAEHEADRAQAGVEAERA